MAKKDSVTSRLRRPTTRSSISSRKRRNQRARAIHTCWPQSPSRAQRFGLLAKAPWYLIAFKRNPSNPDIQQAIYRLEHPQTGSAEHRATSQETNHPMEVTLPTAPVP